MPAEELVQGSRVYIKGVIEGRLSLYHLNNVWGDLLSCLPMALKPVLQDLNFPAELDVQLDVVG